MTFFPDEQTPIRPYAIAPWAEEPLPVGTASMIAALRGDSFCSAFGTNQTELAGHRLPLHGETANATWYGVSNGASRHGSWIKLGVDLPLQGGRCESITALLHNETVIYQRHDLTALTGPCNPGHHATLSFPDDENSGRLSFSPFVYAQTFIEPTETPKNCGYSWLKPNTTIDDLRKVPCIDGSVTDLTRYPARRGFEDIAILCADAKLDFAWSAVAFPEQGYVWFALRNPRHLASTLLWFSNGGRHFAPWNGRHINVMGIEDVTAFFHVGAVESFRPNLLTERGIRTSLESDAHCSLSIPYIQGVTRVPSSFDRVSEIKTHAGGEGIALMADSGFGVDVRCDIDFLSSGKLPLLGFE